MPGLPSFLVIGSAKSGTTTLFSDLEAHEQIYFPVVKEPADLTRDDVLTETGLDAYRRLFANAKPDQILGEASTVYTARPMFEGAAARAKQVLGGDLKLVYLVRDPFARFLSEHRYSAQLDKIPGDINVALRETPRIVERSRYAHQLEPWLAAFPRENLEIVVFENYVADREGTVRALFDFLGARTDPAYKLPESKNKTEGMVVPRGILRRFAKTEFYRRSVRRWVPQSLRDRSKKVLGREVDNVVTQKLTPENEQLVMDRLRPEVEALHRIAGWTKPVWSRFA